MFRAKVITLHPPVSVRLQCCNHFLFRLQLKPASINDTTSIFQGKLRHESEMIYQQSLITIQMRHSFLCRKTQKSCCSLELFNNVFNPNFLSLIFQATSMKQHGFFQYELVVVVHCHSTFIRNTVASPKKAYRVIKKRLKMFIQTFKLFALNECYTSLVIMIMYL